MAMFWGLSIEFHVIGIVCFLAWILAFFITMGVTIYKEDKKMSEDCFVVGRVDFGGLLGGVFVFAFFNGLFVVFNTWPDLLDISTFRVMFADIMSQLKLGIVLVLIMLNLYSLYLVVKSVRRKLKVIGNVIYVNHFLYGQKKISFSEITIAKVMSGRNYQWMGVKVVIAFKGYSELFAVSSDMYGYDILIKRLKDKNLLQYDTPTES